MTRSSNGRTARGQTLDPWRNLQQPYQLGWSQQAKPHRQTPQVAPTVQSRGMSKNDTTPCRAKLDTRIQTVNAMSMRTYAMTLKAKGKSIVQMQLLVHAWQ